MNYGASFNVRFPPIVDVKPLPDTAAMLRAPLPLLILLLASCSERPETAEYFTKVTSLPLCAGAPVHNVNADAPDRSPGFDSIYVVDVSMPPGCKVTFARAVEEQNGAECEASKGCSGNSNNGDFYRVEPLQAGFRVTYAT